MQLPKNVSKNENNNSSTHVTSLSPHNTRKKNNRYQTHDDPSKETRQDSTKDDDKTFESSKGHYIETIQTPNKIHKKYKNVDKKLE